MPTSLRKSSHTHTFFSYVYQYNYRKFFRNVRSFQTNAFVSEIKITASHLLRICRMRVFYARKASPFISFSSNMNVINKIIEKYNKKSFEIQMYKIPI